MRWLLAILVVLTSAAVHWAGGLFARLEVRLEPPSPRPGQTVRLVTGRLPRWTRARCRYADGEVPLYPIEDGGLRALLPVAGDAEGSRTVSVTVEGLRRWRWKAELPIAAGEFPQRTLRLSKQARSLFEHPEVPDARKRLREAFASRLDDQLWDGTFERPVEGARTTVFGARRLIPPDVRYFHKGVDLAAERGSPVRAANRGRVLVARFLPLQGNVVVLDHGQGVQSVYQHMDSLAVEEGRTVDKGQRLGGVGSTGVSTGPHLHWSMVVHGVPVDPEDWLTRRF